MIPGYKAAMPLTPGQKSGLASGNNKDGNPDV